MTPYSVALRQIALSAGMLRGESTPGLQTSYEETPVAQWNLGDGPFPLLALEDALLDAEGAMANAIASTGGHPFRSYLLAFTDELTSGNVMPSLDASGNPIIGMYGSVCDPTNTSLVYTEQPIEVIRRRELSSTYWRIPVYYYKLVVDSIIHTGETVVVEVCTYNRATQREALDANNDMLLPDSLAPAIVAGALAFLGVDKAAGYQAVFDAAVAGIKSGLTSVASVAMAGPTMVTAVSS
jgi:hypothetical protein